MRPDPQHNYFSFTRKERIGILSLVMLILIIFMLPMLFNREQRLPDSKAIDQFRAELSVLETRDSGDSAADDGYELNKVARDGKNVATAGADFTSISKSKLFDFDPNMISASEWKSLGLRDRTIATIQRYRAKGGAFRHPKDLQKIYGLKSEEYNRLLPFVKIQDREKKQLYPKRDTASKTQSIVAKDETYLSYKNPTTQILDINTADSIALISLHGIGPVLASRIIRFREKLGGFYSIDQVAETYGIADSVFKKIKPFLTVHIDSLRKIDINNADINQLKTHPYIGWKLAKVIVQYRQQHGVFTNPGELSQLSILNEADLKKVLPYLK